MSDEATTPDEIRGVLIPVSGARLLLPNTTVSEVITLSTPEPIEATPDWFIGRVGWQGWRVPLVAYSSLVGLPEPKDALNSRVTVLKVFGGNPHIPFVAVVTQGFPRLTTVSNDNLTSADYEEQARDGVRQRVLVGDEEAVIPDMQYLERQVTRALEDADTGA